MIFSPVVISSFSGLSEATGCTEPFIYVVRFTAASPALDMFFTR